MNGPFDNAGDDSRTSVEPLDELLKLLAQDKGPYDEGHESRLTASEPLAIPEPAASPRRKPASPSLPKPSPPRPTGSAEQPYRPANRPPVALVTILDDGAATTGEMVRIRQTACLIGRSEGTITIPHDPLISARHAEIVRSGLEQPYIWHLRDVGSTNGTFVCCKRAPLRPDRIIILGSRRFRPHLPHAPAASSPAETPRTASSAAGLSGWPMLMETTAPVNPLCIRLVGSRLSVGRPGFGNQIELDDPLLANVHAVITQADDGTWWIQATPSHNGVWVQVRSVELTESCRFQCGEQRFIFVIP